MKQMNQYQEDNRWPGTNEKQVAPWPTAETPQPGGAYPQSTAVVQPGVPCPQPTATTQSSGSYAQPAAPAPQPGGPYAQPAGPAPQPGGSYQRQAAPAPYDPRLQPQQGIPQPGALQPQPGGAYPQPPAPTPYVPGGQRPQPPAQTPGAPQPQPQPQPSGQQTPPPAAALPSGWGKLWAAFGFGALVFIVYIAVQVASAFFLLSSDTDLNAVTAVCELFAGAVGIFFVVVLGGTTIAKPRRVGMKAAWKAAAWLFFVDGLLVLIDVLAIAYGKDSIDLASDWPIRLFVVALLCLGVGLFEETVMRGLCLNGLLARMGRTRSGVFGAVILSSLMFGLIHLDITIDFGDPLQVAQNLMKVVQTGMVGYLLASIVVYTRNLWAPILIHAANDFLLLFMSYGLQRQDLDTTYVQTGEDGGITLAVYVVLSLLYIPLIIFGTRMLKRAGAWRGDFYHYGERKPSQADAANAQAAGIPVATRVTPARPEPYAADARTGYAQPTAYPSSSPQPGYPPAIWEPPAASAYQAPETLRAAYDAGDSASRANPAYPPARWECSQGQNGFYAQAWAPQAPACQAPHAPAYQAPESLRTPADFSYPAWHSTQEPIPAPYPPGWTYSQTGMQNDGYSPVSAPGVQPGWATREEAWGMPGAGGLPATETSMAAPGQAGGYPSAYPASSQGGGQANGYPSAYPASSQGDGQASGAALPFGAAYPAQSAAPGAAPHAPGAAPQAPERHDAPAAGPYPPQQPNGRQHPEGPTHGNDVYPR